MIVLDTNVISEVFRPEPERAVMAWLLALEGEVAITAVTLAELLAGIARLPDGARKDALGASVEIALEQRARGAAHGVPGEGRHLGQLRVQHRELLVEGGPHGGQPIRGPGPEPVPDVNRE